MKKYYSLKLNGEDPAPMPNGQLSMNFKIREFRNQDPNIDIVVVDDLQVLMMDCARRKFNLEFFIQVANRNSPYESYHNSNFGDSCATDFDVGNTGLGTIDYLPVVQYLESIGARGIGLYDYNDSNGKHTHFIHMDMRPGPKSFWKCTGLNPDGSQKLNHVESFIPVVPKIPFPEPTRNLKWIKRVWLFRIRGNDVKWLQTALNLANKNNAINVDGDFAEQTHKAVWAFQIKYKLLIDCIAGPATIKKLKEVLGL